MRGKMYGALTVKPLYINPCGPKPPKRDDGVKAGPMATRLTGKPSASYVDPNRVLPPPPPPVPLSKMVMVPPPVSGAKPCPCPIPPSPPKVSPVVPPESLAVACNKALAMPPSPIPGPPASPARSPDGSPTEPPSPGSPAGSKDPPLVPAEPFLWWGWNRVNPKAPGGWIGPAAALDVSWFDNAFFYCDLSFRRTRQLYIALYRWFR